mmetsp:Transcript_32035/g.51456  ORF Transcript_32035/g.51456 Transcript_32035/m.51456 type:complete len:159 (+) Transcript_32035:27-503(+)
MSSGGGKAKDLKLTEEQQAEFRQAFDLFDLNKNGKITHKELKKIMQGLGQNPTEVEIDELIKEIDADGDGQIDFDEFLAMLTRKANTNQIEDDIEKAFKVFDKGNRGKIGPNELREIMLGLGEDLSDEQLNIMIKEIDSDGDGYVTLEDFKTVMLSDD